MASHCSRCDSAAPPTRLGTVPEGWEEHSSTLTGTSFLLCPACAGAAGQTTRTTGDHAADQLRLFIERIGNLEEEKSGISADIKDVYLEAKACGFDVKTMRQIVKLSKLDPASRQESMALLETYLASLGMA